MGKEAQESTIVERFIWSARRNGQWSGWIYLLTDAPVERYKGTTNAGGKRNKTIDTTSKTRIVDNLNDHHLIVANPQPGHLNMTFRDDMPYKRFKTRVIDYVKQDKRLSHVQLIYYLDVDNIVGNNLHVMMMDLEARYNIPPPRTSSSTDTTVSTTSTTMSTAHVGINTNYNTRSWLRSPPTIWFFENKYKHLSVQGGQFVVVRDTSQPCLDRWRELIDANPQQPKDQPSLHAIRTSSDEGNIQHCHLVTMKLEKYLYFPSNITMHDEVEAIDEFNNRRSEYHLLQQTSELSWVNNVLAYIRYYLWNTMGWKKKRRRSSYPYLVHIKNSCNTTAQIDQSVEERYIEDIIQNPILAKKIHIQPDH